MCNLYSITTNQEAIIRITRALIDKTGNMPPLPGVFPDYPAPIRWAEVVRAAATALALLALPGAALADQCLSPMTKFNVCDYAQKVQQELAPSLPMQVSKTLTVTQVTAVGPVVTLGAVWNMTDDQLISLSAANGVTRAQLRDTLDKQTAAFVCSEKKMSAFVRLGGVMQYAYKTIDGVLVHIPRVETCPRPVE